MKKFITLAVCAVFALSASAQRASSSSTSFFSTEKSEKVQWGVQAGLNVPTLKYSEDGDDIKSRAAFHVGVTLDLPVVESFHIVTGLNLSSKGFKVKETESYDGEDIVYTMKGKPLYLELPVLASYRYHISDAAQIEVNFGPYFAFGLGGKVTEKLSYDGESEDEDYNYFGNEDDDEDYFVDKRFDCGLQLGAGVTFAKCFNVGFAYQFGLTNLVDSDDFSVKQRNFMLSVGYRF